MNKTLSLRSHVLRLIVRWLIAPTVSGTAPVAVRRRQLERLTKLSRLPLPSGTQIEATTLGGAPALRARNTRVACRRTVLYLHGGAYAVGSTEVYREFTAHLARAWQAQVYAIDYRLAPEHPYPAALDDALAAYQALLQQGVTAAELVVAGDSAGGNLSLALALRLRDAGLPLPARLVLLSPWTDMTVSGPSAADKPRDDMLITASIRRAAQDYLAGADARAPLVSPLFADLRGLPPTLIQATDTEILLDDARRLAQAMREARVPVELRVWPGLWHVWPLFAGKLPEADAAVAEAAAFLDGRRVA
ncbi:alpha/beta hydrolase [Fontimonas sp. SYSU GA230001]|uniref:alpha/beta hydrolase n=1 Tax=Fontimonas sp. SYSU GA230001 TaxID=3142450 RepID=UPI0032B42D58